MSGESSVRCHCGRGDGAESSCKRRLPSFWALCQDNDCLRSNPARSAAENELGRSKYGRRRTESAPDALLDCLHCGKDLLDIKEEKVARGSKKKHARRYTAATDRDWFPRKSTSPQRTSFGHHQRGVERTKCEICEIGCQEGMRRKGGRCAYARKQNSHTGPRCNQCFTDQSARRDSREEGVGKACRGNSLEENHVSRQDDRTLASSTDRYSRMFKIDDSSGEDSLSHDSPCHKHHHRPAACCKKSATTGKRDDIDNAMCDIDDAEIGLFNINENRHRRSATSIARNADSRAGNKSTRITKSRQRSEPGQRSQKQTCPVHHDKQAERQKEDCKKVQKGQSHTTADRARNRQQLTSTDEADNSEDSETVKAVTRSRAVGSRDSLLVANLTEMLRRHHLCDVTLRANGGEEVRAHKLALAAFSDAFARTYCEGDSRREVTVIDIPDTSADGIMEMLRFIYTSNIRLSPDNVGHVLAAATFLHIDDIIHMCRQMILNPDIDTVVFFSSLAEKYHLREDLTYFYDFICKNFLFVSRTRGWKTLTFSQVFDLLSENNLNVDRELDVFHAAVAWIEGDRANRLTFAADLIGCVRFTYITPDEIAKHVESKQFLFQGDEGKELLLCIYRHHALHTCGCQHGQKGHHLPRRQYVAQETLPVQHDHSNSAYSPQRPLQSRPPTTSTTSLSARPHHHHERLQSAVPEDLILAVGGVNPFQPDVEDQSRQAAQFHPHLNRWTSFTRLPDGRHHHGAVLLGGFLYVIGGSILDDMNPEHLCNPSASCYRYDLGSKRWNDTAPLNVPRMYHATAVLNDVIFVLAGQTQQSKHLASMECYRPEVGEWETGVEMAEGRIGVAVAPYRGQLYAVGGFLETGKEHVVRDTVELFDPRTCSWTSLNGLPSPRCHAALAECVGKLYLVGGSTFPTHSSSVCSLPSLLRYEEKDDRWDRIQTLRTPRHDMGVAVLGSRIFIVGGVSSVDNKVLDDVECYDVETNFWLDDVASIGSPVLGLACVTLLADQ